MTHAQPQLPSSPVITVKAESSTKQEIGVFPSRETAAKFKFCIKTHHLKCKAKRKYYFKCAVPACESTFNSVKDWNVHHLFKHKTVTYKCMKCTKSLRTPSSMKDHELTHWNKPFTCGRYGKTFVHISKLNLHRHLHRRQKLYTCFAAKCMWSYKWPQDLLRHIKLHLKIVHECIHTQHMRGGYYVAMLFYIPMLCHISVEIIVIRSLNMPCRSTDMRRTVNSSHFQA